MNEARWKRWIVRSAGRIAPHAERDLEALVDVSSPSGDIDAAEAAVAVATALLPDAVEVERLECSSSGYARDLLVCLSGTGSGRLLLLGHLDTVVSHDQHHPLRREGDRLHGPGAIDMKGGVALALGVLRELATCTGEFAEIALLLVVDEEWRTAPFAHAGRFADFDACLCFEGGELTAEGGDAVVVSRKAAGTLHVQAKGRAAHSGAEPDEGRNALLALVQVALRLAGDHDPQGENRLTVVPTILRSGEAFNIVPDKGELFVDVRAGSLEAIEALRDAVPAALDGVTLRTELGRRWPAMDMSARAAVALGDASRLLGRPITGIERGGASDASHLAAGAPLLAIDGLGPLGGGSHASDEHIIGGSLARRAEVALALVAALLGEA
jgi:glutamate carboxypeptidase